MIHLKHSFSGHQNPVYALANADQPGFFFSAGNDKGVVEWGLEKMAFIKVLWPVESSVYCLHTFNQQVFAGERSGVFSVFDLEKQEIIAKVQAHTKPIFQLKTLAAKHELLTTGEDGTVAVWSLKDLSEVYRFKVADTTVRTIAVSPDEKEIALGTKDNWIRIYNAEDFSLKQAFLAHSMPVTALAYHPTGKFLVSGGRDAQLNVWSAYDYTLLKNVPAHLFTVYAIAFHPSLPYFATASQDKSIKIWDSENFKLYKILNIEKTGQGHIHSVNSLIWANNGKFLVSTGDDRQVMVWEMD